MLMFDLLVLAWRADITRISTFMVSRELSNRVYARSGVTEGFHNASHHSEVPANIDRLAKLNEYHTRAGVAYFLRKLAEHEGWRRLAARPRDRPVRQRHGEPESARSRPAPDLARRGRRGSPARRTTRARAGGHAVRESARERARQARRAGRVVRRQHRRARGLEVSPMRAAARKAIAHGPLAATALAALALAALAPPIASGQSVPTRTGAGGGEPAVPAPSVVDTAASPLATAAARGDLARVRELLDSGTKDVDAPDRDGTPALHWVARLGDADLVARLLAAGAKVDGADRHGVTPLQVAIGEGDAGVVRRLLEAGADASKLDARRRVAVAARRARRRAGGRARAARARRGGRRPRAELRPNAPDGRGSRRAIPSSPELLLDAGADPNARTRAEPPPRFIPPSESPPGLSKGIGIVRAGWPEDRGKRFPAAGSKTPLLYAARAGDLAATKLLVERGAKLELADGNGVTPLLEAILNANAFRVKREGRTDHLAVASVLLDAGANVNAMDWYGETPLWAAVGLAQPRARARGQENRRARRGARADRPPARRGREPERTHARVPARAPLHHDRSSARSRGSISRGRRRSCGPPRPAISLRCGCCSSTARTRTSRPRPARRR